ncbi:MAG: hypothetical protein F4Y45_05830 [Acidobacteria bacterium]|nr:hypothetical protein [Chloroflexota bacterium]MXY24027.1 hypothetical protein [Acidobacteriota bacterium]MYD15839.1 hypothetical protein [Chloroflexota bacterium]
MSDSSGEFILHPILTVVRLSLEDVLSKIRVPPLPARSPDQLQAGGTLTEVTDAQAYIANSLPVGVWGQCMVGIDFMQGLKATISSDTYFSAHALARSALESFAFGFWICDDRLNTNERYHRALLLHRTQIAEEQRRVLRGVKATQANQVKRYERAFADRLRLIDAGITHFARELAQQGISYPARVPSKTEVVQNVIRDISPIPHAIYGTLSAVVHGDPIFAYGLMSPHTDPGRPSGPDGSVRLSTTITNHLTPAWHAISSMCICLGVASLVLKIEGDMGAMTALAKDVMGFIAHNGDEPLWFRANAPVSDEQLHSLDWYLEEKGIAPDSIGLARP